MASRINGTYNNENMTDVFKTLGLSNNDSSSLSASNNAPAANATTAAAFMATRLPGSEATYPIRDSHSWIEPYYPRDHAYTWPQYQVSNESAYLNDVPAGQHQYPYDTQESIRARMASRINGSYANENMTDVFKTLGLHNNDSSSLSASNNITNINAAAFMASRLPGSEATYPIRDSHSWIEPYYPRDHAYTWPQYQVSNESAYLNDVPAGQHQYPYDTMESIRARMASRINGSYTNDNMTDVFKTLGLHNNDSSSLTVNTTTQPAASFIMRRNAPVAAAPSAAAGGDSTKLHWYRHDAWNEANHNATHLKDYVDANPTGYVVEPLNIAASTPGGADQPPAAFIAHKAKVADGEATLHHYRHEAWNEANHNATHIAEYTADTPAAGYLVPPLPIEDATTPGGAAPSFLARSMKATTNKAAQGEPIGFIMRKIRSRLPGSEATYPIRDSHSWIEPYYPRDHAYTWPQYQVSNESAYLNDVPAGQHQYPYDTIESIRSRYASRINGTYSNENVTDTFKSLGLYNNDTSSLQSQNGANATAASTFIYVPVQKQPQRLMTIAEALNSLRRN